MDPDERAALLAVKAEKTLHEKRKRKMLLKQSSGRIAGGAKSILGGGRGRGKAKARGRTKGRPQGKR